MSAPEQRWVLVPREPSDQMFAKGQQQAEECTDDFTCRSACIPEHVYGAMISAAPKPSEGDLERAARVQVDSVRAAAGLDPISDTDWADCRLTFGAALRAALDALGEPK